MRDANSLESLEAFDHGVHRSTESLLTAEITYMSGEVREDRMIRNDEVFRDVAVGNDHAIRADSLEAPLGAGHLLANASSRWGSLYGLKCFDQSERMKIMTKMNPVVHFEMPAEDRNRMAVFYQEAFGWKAQMLGPEMGEYVVVTTAESDAKPGAPAGAINGGFYLKRPDWPAQYPSIVIAVDDVDSAMKRVVQAGGKVLGEPLEIPGVGRYVSFFDTEGNRVSMLQPNVT